MNKATEKDDYGALMGSRLRALRRRIGESQTQFGQRLGVNKLSVINYESGITAPTARQLYYLDQSGVDATYVAFGYPSFANKQTRDNFKAALSWVKRECQISSLRVSEDDMIDAAWAVLCKLSDAPVSETSLEEEVQRTLRSIEQPSP